MNDNPHKTIYLILILLLLVACDFEKKENEKEQKSDTLFHLLDSEETGITFLNKVENTKDFNIFKYRNFYNGGGVAIGDVNNDGLPDIYFTGNMVKNKLYLNQGNMSFKDVSIEAGIEGSKPWSTGVSMVDINSDGLLDIYVSNAGNMEGNNHDNDLYINMGIDLNSGIPSFKEQATEYNLAKTGFSTHATFFDYDKDGDLDAYILNNSNIPVSSLGYAEQREVRAQDWEGVPDIFRGVGDMLLRNDDGKFIDVSEKAGIYGSLIGFGLGVIVTDINKDLYPDLYVSNDFYERDYLYINNQDGTFTEEIKKWTSHLSLSAMGVDIADINNDGHSEIFITDMLPEKEERVKAVMEFEGYDVFKLKQSKDFYQQYIQNTLQLNNGNESFSEIAYYSGVHATDWSWAGLIFDMDNDGLRDIYITNGINHDLTDLDFVDFFANEIIQKMALTGEKASIDSIINKMPIRPQPNFAYKNNGNLTFTNSNKTWGFELPSMSNGAAYADLDNDGDLDIVVNNVNMEAFVYENKTNEKLKHNYIKLEFHGPEKNPFAVGTTVLLYFQGQTILQELMPFRGFQSSMEYGMTIGLGNIGSIDSLRVIWPNDKTQLITNITPNKKLTLDISNANSRYDVPDKSNQKPLLREVNSTAFIEHTENNYNDFNNEGLIYKLLSQEGPALAVGDIDGDGNDDIYVGGAKNQPGRLYRFLKNGEFYSKDSEVFQKDSFYEDTAALFFDADNDGDQDLIVGSGGNEIEDKKNNICRLYKNNGKGVFSKTDLNIPSTYNNISVIAPYDIDNDGFIDLFIGSRSVPGTYGVDPKHIFLKNNGDGSFVNATERLAYSVKDAGMITDAIWGDIDGDSKKDLITVSDWGTAKIYKNDGRRLSFMPSSLDSIWGWWNTLELADLDNDGDLDIILGNEGSNLHYKPTPGNPMKLFINDFDNNGTLEQITTMSKNGKNYPIHQKKKLTEQLVKLKKQNLKASEYALKSIDELFPSEIVENSIVKKVSHSESMLVINQGNGKFSYKILPAQVQFSCICGIQCLDVDKDGNLDLIMAGNNFEFKPQYSRLDSNYGNVLLGDGKMNFAWQDYSESGFFIKKEVKHIETLRDKEGKLYIVAAINDDAPKLFEVNEK